MNGYRPRYAWLRASLSAVLLVLATGGAFAQSTTTQTDVSAPVAASPAGQGSSTPKLVLSLLDAPKGDNSAATIAQTVTQSMGLMLRLTGKFTVQAANFLDPVVSYDRSVLYYRQDGAKIGIFGTVAPDSSGGYTIGIHFWRSTVANQKPKIFTKKISDVFSVFDAADQLALTVASEAVGKSLAVGTLEIKNQANLANYGVYVDGQLLGRSLSSAKVLTGQRTVIVAVPGPLGDQPLQTFQVDVTSSKPAVITITKNPELTAAAQKPASPSKQGAAKAPTPTGGLTVTTTPAGATVKLDQKVIGTTPLHLFGVPVGTYRLTLVRKYFSNVETVAQITDHGDEKINLKLDVNQKDPGVAKRMLSPGRAAADSAIWSGVQAVTGVTSASAVTSLNTVTDFWTETQSTTLGFTPPIAALSIGLNSFMFRFGNRIAQNPLQTAIIDGVSGLGTFLAFNSVIPETLGSSPSVLSTTLGSVGALVVAGIAVYDIATAPSSVAQTNARTLAYIRTHGSLPPLQITHAHHVIIETGGNSTVRGGYNLSLIPDYLYLAGTLGFEYPGTTSTLPLQASADLRLSYFPFGTSTGRLRPELNIGARINPALNFSSIPAAGFDIGTGSDWVGRTFDIFSRGGITYNPVNGLSGEFLTIGTRLF